VENMFYVSFLVKEGKAKIFIDPNDTLPKINPVGRTHTQDDHTNKKQVRIIFL
jgi:hypothetical protein